MIQQKKTNIITKTTTTTRKKNDKTLKHKIIQNILSMYVTNKWIIFKWNIAFIA